MSSCQAASGRGGGDGADGAGGGGGGGGGSSGGDIDAKPIAGNSVNLPALDADVIVLHVGVIRLFSLLPLFRSSS